MRPRGLATGAPLFLPPMSVPVIRTGAHPSRGGLATERTQPSTEERLWLSAGRRYRPVSIRSRFLLELASDLAVGLSLADIESWGGQVRYDPGLPDTLDRLGALERREIDAVFDSRCPVGRTGG